MSYEASYVKARKKAVKQLKNSNAQQLEIETKKMEDRIRALKEQMFREKEEREKQGGTRWASGKSGPLSTHAQDVLKKKSSKAENPQRRIKVLGDEPLQSYKKKATPRAQQPDNLGSLGCGQCERVKATVVCVECAEKYCVSCFMSFHQKGALKKHSTQTIEQYEAEQREEKNTKSVNYTKPILSPSKKVTRVTSQAQEKSPQFSDTTGHQGGALLEGSYNEEESAQSFAQALMEWRNAGKQEKLWTNPTDTKSNTCETSTTPEPPMAQEVKLTFGPNKSLSYLDRMLLKKHHGDPNFISKDAKSKGKKTKSPENSSQPEIESQLGTNYREIFQSLGASNRKHAQKNGAENMTTSSVVSIQEVKDDNLNMEETTACIVEEENSHPHPQSQGGAMSHSGRVSIMCMTPRGNFEADGEALVLQDVSPVSNTSPTVQQSSPMSRLGVRRANTRIGQNVAKRSQIKDQSDGLARVWSPQPSHVGLSEFFLTGVKDGLPSGRQSRERVTAFGPAVVKPDKLSKNLLSQNVWKPHESIIKNEDSQQQMQEEDGHNGSEVRPESPRPIIPLLREPSLSAKSRDRPDSSSSTIAMPVATDIQYDTQIHDFGIVDFLKSQPNLPNGYEDYSLVHRVSTVTELTLSPNPPVFHWSDDSDDDFLEHLCSRVNQDEQRADQEEADRATLTDLAWELASTTGRLTQCDLDEEEEEAKRNNEGGSEGEFDEDSIENNDLGSGLSSSDEETPVDSYSANVNRPKENDENALAEAEVHALK